MNRDDVNEGALVECLRRLGRGTLVPPVDPQREAHLLAAFDGLSQAPRSTTGGLWWMAAVAAMAVLLIATGIRPMHRPAAGTVPGLESAQGTMATVSVGEFVAWPGASSLPPLESGQLLRVSLPVSMLPSLGLTPPSSRVSAVRADVLVGQDGLTRAVRLVD